MFSRFFIDRPVFAAVLSIVLVIAGTVAVFNLPIAQYPDITPPTVQVTCNYPGASAEVVADTVAAPIEQQVNGVENMLYMSSLSGNDGSYTLTVTFNLGVDLNMAQVLVQNRVSQAMPTLPESVRQNGVTTKKKSPSILLCISFYSEDGRLDQLYLSNYATIQVRDEISRLEGVGDVNYLGQQDYSMRVWLDPEKLAARNLTASDVVDAVKQQNVQVAAGQIGRPPVPTGQDFQYVMSALGRLITPEQFREIIVKTGDSGQVTRLQDIARIDLGSKSEDQSCTLDGKPSVALAVYQLPGSNALDVAERIQAKLLELKKSFPAGVDYKVAYDTTPFIAESINEVFKALRDAIILVAIVVLVFLQNWRSTLIPLVAVPVSLVGTFAIMLAAGFSLNNLSLFGIVLAVGIVVDDAIVVVENVERWIAQGLSPKEAAYKSMEEVTVAVIAIAFGLSAIFIPTAFLTGIVGQFFRQFALTIATATLISAFNSLTLSPALCAILLKPHGDKPDPLTRVLNFTLGWFFKGFNKLFDWTANGYARVVGGIVRVSIIGMLVYVGMLFITYRQFQAIPSGFIPMQDKGYLLANIQLPDSASLERTRDVISRIEKIALADPGVQHTLTASGISFVLNANSSNYGSIFIILKPFHDRHAHDLSADEVAHRLRGKLYREIQDAQIAVFGAPPVDGLGNAGGFKLMVEDRASSGLAALQQQTESVCEAANQQPDIVGAFTQFRAKTPQLYIDVDRTKCRSLGVQLNDVFNTLQVDLGGLYVNDFNQFGRTWQVNVQADSKFRVTPDSVKNLKVRNSRGEMVPLGTLAHVQDVSGPSLIQRYNMYASAAITGNIAPDFSTGQAIDTMQRIATDTLPQGMKTEWTELTLLQILAGNSAILVFPLCCLFVFLTHAAEYESWLLPLAIILIVPMSIMCALFGVSYRGMANDIFTQIGFVVLAGLACKNAVLIVEFAKHGRDHGKPRREAVVEACRLRLRPIVMTSFAFILGTLPLVIAEGAGAEMRRTLGTAVFAGMIGVTFFGLFLTPVFYDVLQWVAEKFNPQPVHDHGHEPAPQSPPHPASS